MYPSSLARETVVPPAVPDRHMGLPSIKVVPVGAIVATVLVSAKPVLPKSMRYSASVRSHPPNRLREHGIELGCLGAQHSRRRCRLPIHTHQASVRAADERKDQA